MHFIYLYQCNVLFKRLNQGNSKSIFGFFFIRKKVQFFTKIYKITVVTPVLSH